MTGSCRQQVDEVTAATRLGTQHPGTLHPETLHPGTLWTPTRRGLLGGAGAGLAGIALAACGQGTPSGSSSSAGAGSSGSTGSSGAAGATGAPGSGGGLATVPGSTATTPAGEATPATAAQMRSRATVPVLCYHQVRPWTGDDTEYTRSMLVIPPEKFAAQLDGMAAAGYTPISPAQYATHLQTGQGLPAKPVILTLDDGKDNQVSQAFPALAKRGMTGTFFIMTVVLGNAGWMRRDYVKKLADGGMTIGSHTWDHHMVTKYSGSDYATQLEKPRALLSELSGQDVVDFAYPYGAWNPAILPHLTKAGYTSAYQLQEKPLDAAHHELTLRRILAVSTWTGDQVVAKLASFA